jgi:hypothetical protein
MPKIWNLNRDGKKIPKDAVYVGRPTQWGNRYSHLPGKAPVLVDTRHDAVAQHREWFYADEQTGYRARVRRELRGKDLVCFCTPYECHATTLLEYANGDD